TSLEGLDGMQVADESLPVDQRLELEQLKKRVRAAMEQLPEKERKLLEGYYFRGKTLEEAGAEIGQSKSWASRLHARAVETLKKILEEEENSHGGTTGRNLGGADRSAKAARPGAAAGAKAGAEQVRSGAQGQGAGAGPQRPSGGSGPARPES